MKKLLLSTAAALVTLTSVQAFADIKMGIVDMNQVLQKSPLMATLNGQLIKKFQPRQDEINAATKELQDEVNQLNLNGPTMTADARTKMQNKIIADKANVQILTATLQRDLAIAKDHDTQVFTSKLTEVVNKIAQDGKYDLIQQSAGFAFINSKLDITQQVIQEVK